MSVLQISLRLAHIFHEIEAEYYKKVALNPWSKYCEHQPDSIQKLSYKSSDKFREFAVGVASKCRSDKEVIDSVTLWVQSHVEVISNKESESDPWYPFIGRDYERMVKNGHGTLYEVLSLAHYMLAVNKVATTRVLIFDKREGTVDEEHQEFASISEVRYLLLVGDKAYLTFPHIKDIHPSYVPEMYHGARGLRICRFSCADTVYPGPDSAFVDLNTENMTPSLSSITYDLELSDSGSVFVRELRSIMALLQPSSAAS